MTLEQFEEKEKRVQHLEEVNISLKQTNDDLNEELAELRKQLGELRQKVCVDGRGREVFYLILCSWKSVVSGQGECGEWEGKGKMGRAEGMGEGGGEEVSFWQWPLCVLSLQLDVMEQSSRQLEDEKRELLANLNVSRH